MLVRLGLGRVVTVTPGFDSTHLVRSGQLPRFLRLFWVILAAADCRGSTSGRRCGISHPSQACVASSKPQEDDTRPEGIEQARPAFLASPATPSASSTSETGRAPVARI